MSAALTDCFAVKNVAVNVALYVPVNCFRQNHGSHRDLSDTHWLWSGLVDQISHSETISSST
jgi:hypothetical protein